MGGCGTSKIKGKPTIHHERSHEEQTHFCANGDETMKKQGKYYASLEGLRAAFEQSKQSEQTTNLEKSAKGADDENPQQKATSKC